MNALDFVAPYPYEPISHSSIAKDAELQNSKCVFCQEEFGELKASGKYKKVVRHTQGSCSVHKKCARAWFEKNSHGTACLVCRRKTDPATLYTATEWQEIIGDQHLSNRRHFQHLIGLAEEAARARPNRNRERAYDFIINALSSAAITTALGVEGARAALRVCSPPLQCISHSWSILASAAVSTALGVYLGQKLQPLTVINTLPNNSKKIIAHAILLHFIVEFSERDYETPWPFFKAAMISVYAACLWANMNQS